MKVIKHKKSKRFKFIVICCIIAAIFIYATYVFNRTVEPQLQAIAKQHTGFAINNIVKEVLADIEYDSKELLQITRDDDMQITSIEYNSNKLNELLYSALTTIDASLLAAQDGKKDPGTKEVFYEDGIIYELPIGYFTHSYLFYNKGPNVKVRMKMLNDVTGEIKTDAASYGVNNTLIKILLVVKVEAQVITFIGASDYKCKIDLPLVVQVVNGRVPNILPYTANNK